MKAETYEKAKSLVNAADNVSGIIGMIETKNGLGENLSAGIFVGISQDNIDWLVSVCKERYNDLLRQLDEL